MLLEDKKSSTLLLDISFIYPSPARQVHRCVSVQHPPICGVLPHHLGVSLQQQVHCVLDENVTTKNKYELLCHLASILSRVVQGCLLPDVLDVGLCPGIQKLLDTLRYWAVQCSAVSLSPLVRFTFRFGTLGPVSRRTLDKEL